MVKARIVEGLDVQCADDSGAQDIADRWLADADPSYDAIEAWQGLRLVCRLERALSDAEAAGARRRRRIAALLEFT